MRNKLATNFSNYTKNRLAVIKKFVEFVASFFGLNSFPEVPPETEER